MLLSDNQAEITFRNKSTAYAVGILHGGIFAAILGTLMWGLTLAVILYNNGYWA